MMLKKAGLFFFVLMLTKSTLFAQDRPKIGLALSGGGALGLAHIGTLKIMEDAGIVPDYITGTSMGSLVGALYAIGYSPDEIEEVAQNANWELLLSNKIPLNEIAIEEKAYHGRYIIELPGKGLKLGLPPGALEGQKISQLFSELTRSVHHIDDFNEFPIPFAAIAADIETVEAVVMNSGSLQTAMRASMAIPGVFTPVERDGRLLVDGGLIRNFPVQDVIDMGADYVIGSYVAGDMDSREELDNLASILLQAGFAMGTFDSRAQKTKTNLLIEPQLKGFTSASFQDADTIIERGLKAARPFLAEMIAIRKSWGFEQPMMKPDRLPERNEYQLTGITVEGNEEISDQFILGRLEISDDNVLKLNEIDARISAIYGTKYFDKVDYQLIPNEDGRTFTLAVSVIEAKPTKLKTAFHYDTENDFGLNLNYTYRNLIGNGSRLLFEADIAKNFRLWLNYFKHLGRRERFGVFIEPRYQRIKFPLFTDDGDTEAIFQTNYTSIKVGGQTVSGKNHTIGGQLEWEFTQSKPEVGDSVIRAIDRVKVQTGGGKAFVNRNTLNRRYFPQRGSFGYMHYRYAFFTSSDLTISDVNEDLNEQFNEASQITGFHEFKLIYLGLLPLGSKVTLGGNLNLTFSTLDFKGFNFTDYSFVGGFNPQFVNGVPFVGAKQSEFQLANFMIIKGLVQWELLKNIFITGSFNYLETEYPMSWISDALITTDAGGAFRRYAFGLELGIMTAIGPIQLAMAKDSDRSKLRGYVNVGFFF